MTAEQARLRRLKRLERVRALARQDALRAAAEAEAHLSQLAALAQRTEQLVAEYRTRQDCTTGAELQRLSAFAEGLTAIGTATSRDAGAARQHADGRQQELAQAERRRAAAEERVHEAARGIAQQRQATPLGARREFGTGLEQ
jgi:hypothetical protein